MQVNLAGLYIGWTNIISPLWPERVWIKEETLTLIQQNETIADYYHQRLIPNAAWNKLIKRSFIYVHGLYFRERIIHEDILWMFYVVKYLSAVVLVKKVTNYYHIRPGSISTSIDAKTEGISYSIVYDDILHNLTIGREDKELIRYVNDFCKCYLKHKTTIPVYKGLHKIYQKKAWQFGCWHVYMVLTIISIISRFGNPSKLLGWLNNMRWRVKRMKR